MIWSHSGIQSRNDLTGKTCAHAAPGWLLAQQGAAAGRQFWVADLFLFVSVIPSLNEPVFFSLNLYMIIYQYKLGTYLCSILQRSYLSKTNVDVRRSFIYQKHTRQTCRTVGNMCGHFGASIPKPGVLSEWRCFQLVFKMKRWCKWYIAIVYGSYVYCLCTQRIKILCVLWCWDLPISCVVNPL